MLNLNLTRVSQLGTHELTNTRALMGGLEYGQENSMAMFC